VKDLVEVKSGEVFCDSLMVAEKFNIKHARVLIIIANLLKGYSKIKGSTDAPLKFQEIEKEYRGQTFKAYFMDRRTFSLLAMRFKGKNALEWQIKFNDAFYLMEKNLLVELTNKNNIQWVQQRSQGKLIRKEETDAIQDFVNYAIKQGSQHAQFYFKHITVACYRCLNLIEAKKPKLRDTLNLMQLNQLMLAEVVAERSLKKWMIEGVHYKEIFDLVKTDIETFAKSLMLPSQQEV
jgi:phage regulator Rha-like protein